MADHFCSKRVRKGPCTASLMFYVVVTFICFSQSDAFKASPIQRRLPSVTQSASRLRLFDPNVIDPAIANNVLAFLGSANIPKIVIDIPNIFAPLTSTDSSFLGIFSILDASRFFFLPGQTKDFLATFPVIVRVALGFLAIDVLPAVADVVLLRIIWSKMIAVRPPMKDIDITTLPKQYDVAKITAFYEKNPRLVIARATEIFILAKDFLFGLFQDYQSNQLKTNQPIRAIQFTELITTLGPTFIKVGQALSIRPDLASPAYLEELVKLQDQVPPFSSKLALKIIGK